MRKTTLTICALLLLIKLAYSQTPISGIINHYHAVNAIDTCSGEITLDGVDGLQEGMKVLLIQMKGAVINESNSSNFGDVLNLNHAGNFEKGEIASIAGSSVFLKNKLLYQYAMDGFVQLISIPQYDNAEVIDVLEAQAWNGTTGGVLVFEVQDSLSLNASISATGKGFRGGDVSNVSPNNCEWFFNPSAYHYDSDNWRGSGKGEGIAAFIFDKESGRGAQANGGGGGNDHNAGGGGGGNVTAGGKGGRNEEPSNFGCRGLNPGVGGKAINATNNLFLGGGGGAGHSNNDLGTNGGNGGGIIIITANHIQGNDQLLAANGVNVSIEALGDGAGGGGAGGTILLNVNSIHNLQIEAKGGNGGTVSNNLSARCMGPGGGGSGGRLLLDNNALSSSSTNVDGGMFGLSINSSACSDSPNDAEVGTNGVVETLISVSEGLEEIVPTEIITEPSYTTACLGDTLVLQIDAIGNDLNYQWQIDTMSGFENIIENAIFNGVTSSSLTINNLNTTYNGINIRCVVSNDCFDAQSSQGLVLNINTVPSSNFDYVLNNGSVQFTNQSTNANTYIWNFGDNTMPSDLENPAHSYLQNGQYEVQLIATNECGMDTTTQEIDITIVALHEITDRQVFEVYPNPTKDFLMVNFLEQPSSRFSLQVIGLDGKVYTEETYSSANFLTTYQLELNEIPAGIFAIRFISEEGFAIRRFVKL